MEIRVVWTILNNNLHRTTNYTKLHEDGGHRIDNSFNVHRQNNRMTGGDRGTLKERRFYCTWTE